ncbi:MAG: bestrophin-like domain [Myxococcaceae bacterium]
MELLFKAPLLVLPIVFAALLGCLVLGRRLGVLDAASGPERSEVGAVDGAVFALLGLLIAFTFSGAADRFERRRSLIVHEANAIGTAYLRLDVLPPATQPALRESFRQYLDARLAVYRAIPDMVAVHEALRRAETLQDQIWAQAVGACQASPGWRPDQVVLPAINEMIDITTTRTVAAQDHPPTVIFAMLFALALVASVLAGYAMAGGARARRMHAAAFALVLSTTVFVILDLEYPRAGVIRIDAADQLLVDVRAKMR